MPAKNFLIVLFVIFSFLHNPKKIFSYYSDDFSGSSLNSNLWQPLNNSGSITVSDGKLKLFTENVPLKSFPYIVSNNDIFPISGPFSITIGYRYLTSGNFGSGITISSDIAPQNGVDPGSNIPSYIAFTIWQDKPNGLMFNKHMCNYDGTKCNVLESIYPLTNLPDFSFHTLRIDYTESGQYLIYTDNNKDAGYISAENQHRPKVIWIGNSYNMNTFDYWTSFEIDYIKVVPVELRKTTIIIPGMGASWDFDALLNGNSGSNWQIPDFVKVYDGIITSFDNTDEYSLNTNLFVFTYDWRKPLDLIADDFNNFVHSLDIGPNEKINLVGHSMGGLVARAYAQKYKANDNINKIYLLGAPNNGTVKAYGTWEGAEIWDNAWWSKTALAIASHLGTQPSETQVDSIRRMIPSVKDMLPTNNFLYMNGDLLPWSNLIQKNNYLKNLNNDYLSINNIVTNIVSDDVSTKKYINAEPRTLIDELLDKWEDGKPKQVDPFQYAQGDGTVTYEEAKGLFTNNIDGVGGHGDLVTNIENIKSLFRLIGLDETKAVAGSSESIDFENVLIAILKSPGRLELCDKSLSICNEKLGYYFSGYKLFILPNYDLDDLVVRVYEDGLGDYSLHIGYVTNMAKWTVINGLLSGTGQIDYYNLKVSDDNISLLKDETGPTIPSMLGFHDPEVQCGGITSSHNVTVDWSDAEDESGVAGYMYSVNYPNGNNRGTWTTFFQASQYRGRLNEGIHYIKVKAKDRAGNYSYWSEECSITADWTAPQVSILSPTKGTYLPSKLPELTYLVADNIDKNPEVTVFGYSKENGDHVVRVVATDEAGNQGEATVNYTIQSPPAQKAQCLSNGWKLFTLSQFKNQGECISFVERNLIARNKYFWWIL